MNQAQITALFDASLFDLGRAADRVRRRMHPEDLATFVIDLNLNYTNICAAGCRFCAFYRRPGEKGGWVLEPEAVYGKLKALRSVGGTQIMLQGGVNPKLPFTYYLKLLRGITERFPDVYIHSFSPTEILYLARWNRLSVRTVLIALREAGLRSLPGAVEILAERVHRLACPGKASPREWLDIMRTAHELGIKSTATMVIGLGETHAERAEHLVKIRDLQDRTGGFRAFIPWTFSPAHTRLAHLQPPGGIDYLKNLAISRLALDNIPHIHSGWVTEGFPLAQTALAFGADDMGGILMEENVVEATGIKVTAQASREKMIRLTRGAGRIPAQRDTEYNILRRY